MLIVAAPHSKCVSKTERDCDLDAEKVARKIVSRARKEGIKTIGVLSQDLRSKVDNNRDGSEDSDFRKTLDRVLRRDGLFMEIHSHPNVGRFKGYDMTIFNLDRNKEVASELYKFLENPRVDIQKGEDVMAIQKNYKGLMLEFNEGRNHDPIIEGLVAFAKQKKSTPMFGGREAGLCFIFIVILILFLFYEMYKPIFICR